MRNARRQAETEEQQTQDQVEAHRGQIARTPLLEIVDGQLSRADEQQPQRAPQPPVKVRDVVPGIVQNSREVAGARVRVLTTSRAVRTGQDRLAVPAALLGERVAGGCVTGSCGWNGCG